MVYVRVAGPVSQLRRAFPLPSGVLSTRRGPLGLSLRPMTSPELTLGGAGDGQEAVTRPRAKPRPAPGPQRLSVAPMMDWTDLHYRQLARLISKHTWLYTEMVVDKTLLYNPDHDRFLLFPPEQHPIACQLGGSDPASLAAAAKIVESYGYDEINLNVGCPSDRVAGAGCFGAALMLRPELVAECCAAMAATVSIPITVKCRLGVDDRDSYELLTRFVHVVSTESPVTHFVIHARKAFLKGLNPHQNRTVPPLRYHWVWALKRDFPHLSFSLNGGVPGLDVACTALAGADSPLTGVMVGRAAYHQPWDVLADADRRLFGASEAAAASRRQVLDAYAVYADAALARWAERPPTDGWKGPSLRTLVKPLLGMFAGAPRARQWRAAVDKAFKAGPATVRQVLDTTLPVLLPETLDEPPRGVAGSQGNADLPDLPAALGHWEPELPPTPEWLQMGSKAQATHSAWERELGTAATLGDPDEEQPLRLEDQATFAPEPAGASSSEVDNTWVVIDRDQVPEQ